MFLKLRPAIPISIHALREEGDFSTYNILTVREDFYPRPPRGGRHQPDFIADFYFIFLSTPSARRATSRSGNELHPTQFLSTPSARRATALHDNQRAHQ